VAVPRVHPFDSVRSAFVDTYDWLLALHVSGAFLLVGGSVFAAVCNVLAQRTERPSEIALFFGLVRVSLPFIGIGSIATLVIGLWLVHHVHYSWGDFWIWGAILLWLVMGALGGMGGRVQTRARALAERLAAEGDMPNAELTALARDRGGNLLNYGAGVATLLILVLMIWKPGA
jgi:uncharacterized membrane protein